MNSFLNYIKNWLGYDRRERRSASTLLVIIIIVFISRYIVPGKPAELRNITSEIADFQPVSIVAESIRNDTITLFNFDPNLATFEDLVKLGLSEKQANTILNFRKAGGKFNEPSDFAIIYGIDEQKIAELLPYIRIGLTSGYEKSIPGKGNIILLDLNKCDSTLLESLPGIGPVLAARIVKYRNLLGGYAYKDQLLEVYGITNEIYILFADKVYADSAGVTRIKINSAAYSDFLRHPYFETGEINSVLKYRELMGHISNINELITNNIITIEKIKKMSPYLSFE
jgi:competence protein ComEA